MELARASIERLAKVGSALNAVAELTEDLALEQARDADRRLAEDVDAGPLCGIPWAPKDVVATAGVPTRWGAPPFREQVFARDATVVHRLARAGAVVVGKLAMIELAGAGLYRWANASLDGPCRNPWDTDRWAGGSSSGSAAAVAAGLTAFSVGGETGGSLVIPAAFCGVTALRPSFGLVSRYGALQLAWSMDKLGPVCRTADDCALVLATVGGVDEFDPTTVDWEYVGTERRRFRLGVLQPADPDTDSQAAFDAAIEVFEGLGMEMTAVTMPDVDFVGIHDRIATGEIAAHHEIFIRSGGVAELIDEAQQTALVESLGRSATSYPQAAHQRVTAVRAVRRMFHDVDAIIAPTVNTEAVELDADLLAYRHRQRGGNMFLGSVAGVPELTLPMGFGPRGLPVGLSVIGDVRADPTVLRIGALFQEATSWHRMRPSASVAIGAAT